MSNLNNNLINDEVKNFQDAPQDKQLQKIQQMKTDIQESIKNKEDNEDPDNILYKNIDRANKFLDILENEVTKEDPNEKTKEKKNIARLFEVSAQLINAITTATSSIAGSHKDEMEYEYKLQLLEIKNKELEIKSAIQGGGSQGNTTNNLIISDRESIIDMIQGKKKEETEE